MHKAGQLLAMNSSIRISAVHRRPKKEGGSALKQRALTIRVRSGFVTQPPASTSSDSTIDHRQPGPTTLGLEISQFTMMLAMDTLTRPPSSVLPQTSGFRLSEEALLS